VVSNFHEECTCLALELGRELLLAAIKDEPFDITEAIKPLRRKVDRKYLGPSTAAIVNAPKRARFTSACSTTATSSSSATGRHAPHLDGRDRQHQRHRRDHLARQGPDQGTDFLGRRAGAGRPEVESAEDAVEAAEDIGFPWSSSRPTAIMAVASSST
jgi:cyanophycin synthetase